MTLADSGIARGLAALVAFVIEWRKTTILVVFAAAAAGLDYASSHLGINTDTANMISPTLSWRQDFIAYRDGFPLRDRNIVVVIDGPSRDVTDVFASALAARLAAEPEHFETVFLPAAGDFFERNGLMYLSLPELERLSDRLVGAQPLLARASSGFSGAGVLELARESLTRADAASAVGADQLDVFYGEIASAVDAAAEGGRRPVEWSRLLDGSDAASVRQLLLLRPVLDFDRIQPAREAIDSVRAAARDLQSEIDPSVSVRLTGTVAMEHEELESVTRGASAAGLAALVMVTLVLFWALRSVTLLLIAVTTLLVGLAFTATFAALTVGHLNLLSVAFAVLYVGLGVDFILHLSLRLKELLGEGHELDTALVETAHGVGASLVICAVTTAAGFYAFVPTEFDGVSELGLISGTGMFISLAVSLVLLPALIAQFWRRPAARVHRQTARLRIPRLAFLTPRQIVALAVVLVAASAFVLPGLTFDSNPIHLRDPNAESIVALNELAADSEAPLLSLVALADDDATAKRWAAELEPLDSVARVVTVDSLVPADQEDKQLLLEDLSLYLGPGFADVEEAPFDAAALRRELAAVAELPVADDPGSPAAVSLTAAARRLLDRLDGLPPAAAAERLAGLDRDLRSSLPRQLARLASGLRAEPFGRASLPPELAERWINGRGQELIEIVPAEDVNDNAAAARFVTAVKRIVPHATGLPVVYQEASATVVHAFQLALLYAFGMVTVLLVLFLRNLKDTLLVLVPILFSATVTAGMTVWLGLPLNFANIIALPLLVGVGVDSGIHMVHRMRTEPPGSRKLLETSTSRAVLASGLTTIASFGNLAFSPHLGMSSMGQLLTIGMAVTLVATLVVLPALMRFRLQS